MSKFPAEDAFRLPARTPTQSFSYIQTQYSTIPWLSAPERQTDGTERGKNQTAATYVRSAEVHAMRTLKRSSYWSGRVKFHFDLQINAESGGTIGALRGRDRMPHNITKSYHQFQVRKHRLQDPALVAMGFGVQTEGAYPNGVVGDAQQCAKGLS